MDTDERLDNLESNVSDLKMRVEYMEVMNMSDTADEIENIKKAINKLIKDVSEIKKKMKGGK